MSGYISSVKANYGQSITCTCTCILRNDIYCPTGNFESEMHYLF